MADFRALSIDLEAGTMTYTPYKGDPITLMLVDLHNFAIIFPWEDLNARLRLHYLYL